MYVLYLIDYGQVVLVQFLVCKKGGGGKKTKGEKIQKEKRDKRSMPQIWSRRDGREQEAGIT